MNICPECYEDVPPYSYDYKCRCGWEAPKQAVQPMPKVFRRMVRGAETESDRLARERCMATMKTFSIGSGNPHAWAHKLADQAKAGKVLSIGQMAKLRAFEVNTGERLFEVQECPT